MCRLGHEDYRGAPNTQQPWVGSGESLVRVISGGTRTGSATRATLLSTVSHSLMGLRVAATFDHGIVDPLFAKRVFEKSCTCEAIQHEAKGCNTEHGLGRLHGVFIVFAQATVATEPCKAAFDDPSKAGNLERSLVSFHNLQLPT